MAATAEKVVVELEAAYQDFVRETERAGQKFEDTLEKMVKAGSASERQIKEHFSGILDPSKNTDIGEAGEKAGATFGSRFGIGFVKTVLTAILGGAFLDAIVKDAKAMGDLEDAARRAGLAIEKMQEIVYTVRREGLGEAQAVKDIEKLTKLIQDAANNPRNSLNRLFEVNGITVGGKDVNAVLLDLARLMQNAPEGAKTTIAELAGLSEKWISVLEKGPAEFQRIQQEARNAGAVLDEAAFRKAEEFRNAWNEATTRWGDHMRSTINALLPALDVLITKVLEFGGILAKAGGKLAEAPGLLKQMTFGGDLNALSNSQLNDLRAIYRYMGNDAEKKIAAQIEGIIAARNSSGDFGVPGQIYTMPRAATGDNSTRTPGPYKGGTGRTAFDGAEDAIRKRIILLEAEEQAIGKTLFERDQLRASAELLAAAEKAGIPITQELIDHTTRLGTAYAEAALRVRQAKDEWEAANSLAREFGNAAINGMDALIFKTKSLNQVLADTLRSLAQMAAKAAFLGEGPLAVLFGTKSDTGGVGGIMGGLLGGFKGLFGGFRAGGGGVNAGMSYIVGENGPELFKPNASGHIYPNSALAGGGQTVVMNNDFRDASANAIPAIMVRLNTLERSLPSLVPKLVADSRRTNPWGG